MFMVERLSITCGSKLTFAVGDVLAIWKPCTIVAAATTMESPV